MKRSAAALVVAALALSGCTSTGLAPFPTDMPRGGSRNAGLNPFPGPGRAQTRHVGLNAFPEAKSATAGRRVGLNPFPLGACDSCASRPEAGSAPVTVAVVRKPAAPTAAAPAPAPAPAGSMAPPERGEEAYLRLRFEKGSTLRYRMAVKTLVKSPMFGEDGMKMHMGFDMLQEVKDVRADGAAVVAAVMECMSMEMNNPFMGEFKVDTRDAASMSKAKENPMMGQMVDMLTAMVGKTMNMTMDRTGKTLDVDLGEVGAMMKGMGGMGGGGDLNNLSGVPGAFPEQPIKQGMSWPLHQEAANPLGEMVTEGAMTVKEWDAGRGVAVIAMEGIISMKPKAGGAEADPNDPSAAMMAMIKVKEGRMSGLIRFDVKRGRVESSVSKTTMSMESPMGDMSVEANADLSLIP